MRDGTLPSFSLDFGGAWYEVTPDNYSIEVGSDVCAPCLGGYSISYWVLGQAFLRDRYVIHDYANGRLGFMNETGAEDQSSFDFNLRGFLSVTWGLGFSFAVFVYIWLNRPPPKQVLSSTSNKGVH